ncbi:MAG: putative ABC transporter permease [Clostridia bacterium]|nr:putative ABC transporter permease [Clostridia bacterium]
MDNDSKEKFDLKENFSFYVCCFITYCFIGWLYEVIWEAAIGHGFVNRGFLYGPYLPIYGFGVLILYFILRNIMKKKIIVFGKINIMPIVVFLIILVIASGIEYFASWIMELLFHKRWWDYSKDLININGRVSLRNSSVLTSGAMVLLYIVHPILNKLYKKISENKLKILSTIIIVVVTVDFIVTLLGYVK